MSTFFSRSSLLLFCALFFVTCKKESDPEPEPENNNPANPGDFRWKTSGGATVVADSAYYYSQFTTIYAFKNGTSTSIEVNLSSLAAGSYSLSSATGNVLTYVQNASTFTSAAGSFNIANTSNNKLSGDFDCSISNGSIATTLSGTFNTIPHR
jgi:hypothetical protein